MAITVMGLALYSCSISLISDPQYFHYFPPFEANRNRLALEHLGAEYWKIAQAMREGRGFADPFFEPTGPTAWMPPALSYLEAGVSWVFGDRLLPVMVVMLLLQTATWILTGWLALGIGWSLWGSRSRWPIFGFYLLFLLQNFHLAFQVTHDPWLMMLGLDALIAGSFLLQTQATGMVRTLWGLLGGALALCGPVLGLTWGVLTLLQWPHARHARSWLFSATLALVVVSPWIARNYLVFGKLIPIKSNAFYELFQAQTETPDGLVRNWAGFETHPYKTGVQRDEYRELGEQAFLEKKRTQFLAAVQADPADFLQRVWNRFAGAVLVYVPMEKQEESYPVSAYSLYPKIVQPLPLFAIAILLIFPQALKPMERVLITLFVVWLLPYIVVSYYDRYGFPLMGVKILLCTAALQRLAILVKRAK